MSGPIDVYLDDLVSQLSTRRPRQLRSLLAEVEAHLHDEADAGIASGLTPDQAEVAAVARFGSASVVADAERNSWRPSYSLLVQQFLGSAFLLGGIAALAVGVSGIGALVVHLVAGSRYLVDSPRQADLTASACARWLQTPGVGPAAPGCSTAATHDWTSEVIGYRLAAGLLGLLLVIAFVVLRRQRHSVPVLPRLVSDTIAAGAFTVAGVWLLAAGVDAIVVSQGFGSGQWLSAAPVALVAGGVFGLRLVHDLRQPDPLNTAIT
jgi:hypothetical protein